MMGIGILHMGVLILHTMCLIKVSLGFNPIDYYFLDCGSPSNTSVGNRLFESDNFHPNFLSTPQNISINSNLIPSSTFGSPLYESARVLNGTSHYNFSINQEGRFFIRLYFYPLINPNFNLTIARFSVSAQNFTLFRDFQPQIVPIVKEYSLNLTSNYLLLTFTPFANSFAFINALEVFLLPDGLIPNGARTVSHPREYQSLTTQALETIKRINMGNQTVLPPNDTLWRVWVSDHEFLMHDNLATFVSNTNVVNYTRTSPTRDFAPVSVYGTATRLNSSGTSNFRANMTWLFNVSPGFDYLIRFHFCDIVSVAPSQLYFNVYLNSWFVVRDLDLSKLTSNVLGVPYYMDIITRLIDRDDQLNVSVGPSDVYNAQPDGILNGLEIMKISNSRGSLDDFDSEIQTSKSKSKVKIWVIVGSVVLVSVLVLGLVLFLVFKGRRRSNISHSLLEKNSEYKIGYQIPFAQLQAATGNFDEGMVVGSGGFGKVYKGVLKNGTKVAVKRCGPGPEPRSRRVFSEFMTEIEMLSKFRHRHLVSLVGYCNEQNEMIIVYEYMENGSLKDRLPGLNWRQRLEICVGSARGLHYLHTGSSSPIIHRDVKPANILLDENLTAKVADFGISKNGPGIDQTHVTTAVKGSFGYLDPEYLITQKLTEKSDVYSFGVVLLEILAGRPVIGPSGPNLIEWARKRMRKGELEKIVEGSFYRDEIKGDCLRKFGEMVEKCLAERGVDRPGMGDVLWNLEFALRIQGNGDENMGRVENGISGLEEEIGVSTTEFSSVGDLAGVSMSRMFSEMVKAG